MKEKKLIICGRFAYVSLAIASGIILRNTDAYGISYVLMFLLGLFCIWHNQFDLAQIKKSARDKQFVLIIILAVLFAFMLLVGNYNVLRWHLLAGQNNYFVSLLKCFVRSLVLFAFFFLASCNVLVYIRQKNSLFQWKECQRKKNFKSIFVWLLASYVFFFLYFYVFTNCEFPGNLTEDSFNQITQILTGQYSNHHPIVHTFLIKIGIWIGSFLSEDFASQIATYSVLQIICVATCFGYAIATCYEMKLPMKYLVGLLLFYLLMPYHIDYSYTMWKDVGFGVACLMFFVSTYRLIFKLKYQILNYMICMISFCGVGLLRSNGLFVAVFTTLMFFLFGMKKNKTIAVMLLAGLVICFGTKYMATAYLDIEQPDRIEFLSIPAQQIARVVTRENDLSEDETRLLDSVVEVDKIAEEYVEYISDPIKDLVRQNGNQDLLAEKKMAFFWLYLKLGIRHPMIYVQAWVEETKGFWLAGYEDKIWPNMIVVNDYHVRKICDSEYIDLAFDKYCNLFKTNCILQMFISIGLFVWGLLLLLYIAYARRDRVGGWLLFPMVAVIISLLISTPVATEFRYAYALFCTLPFGICVVFRPNIENI